MRVEMIERSGITFKPRNCDVVPGSGPITSTYLDEYVVMVTRMDWSGMREATYSMDNYGKWVEVGIQ